VVISAKVSSESAPNLLTTLANVEWLLADLARRAFRPSISTERGTFPVQGDGGVALVAVEQGTLVEAAAAAAALAGLFIPPSLELRPNDDSDVDDL